MDEDAILAEMLTRQRQKKKSEIHALWPMIRKALNNHVPIRDIYEILRKRTELSCSYGYFTQTVSRIQLQPTPTQRIVKSQDPTSTFAALTKPGLSRRSVQGLENPADLEADLLSEKLEPDTKQNPAENSHQKSQGPLPGTGKGFSMDYDIDDLI